MNNKKVRNWFVGLIIFVVGAEILYLAVANMLLSGSFLPQWLNRNPEKLSIEWSSGWTAVPGHLNLEGLKIRGQTPEQPFQLSMGQATARVALLSLPFKTVKFYDLKADDITVSLPKHTSRSEIPSQIDEQPGWQITIGSAAIERIRQLEFNDYRFTGEGQLWFEHLSFLMRGPVAIDRATFQLHSGELNVGPESIAQDLQADANIRVDPFVPSENPGTKAAEFVSGTIVMAGEIGSYDFINHYLTKARWLQLRGRGNLSGTFEVERGKVMAGSELVIDSSNLIVDLDQPHATRQGGHYSVRGAGTVRGSVEAVAGEQKARLQVALRDITMEQMGQEQVFLRAQRFQLMATTPSIDLGIAPTEPAVVMEWRVAEMPNVAVLNRYFSDGLPFSLGSGHAQLSGHLSYADRVLAGTFDLAGEKIAGTIFQEPVVGQLGVKLNIKEIDLENQRLDLSGTHFQMQAATSKAQEASLQTEIDILQAQLQSPLSWDELKQHVGQPPLSGVLKLKGRVGNIDFLNNFFPNQQGLKFGGDGRMSADLRLNEGQLAPGSVLEIKSDRLVSEFLDYQAKGTGEVRGAVVSGEEEQETQLQVALRDMEMRRTRGNRLFLRAKDFQLNATTPSLALSESLAEPVVTLEWQDAVMPNVAVLDAYFPVQFPFRLSSGSARLNGRLGYADRSLSGKFTLAGNKIAGTIFDERVVGRLGVDLVIAKADLDTRRLDLSGTRLQMQAASAGGKTPLKTEIEIPMARLESAVSWGTLEPRRDRSPLSGTLKLDGRVANISFLNDFLHDKQGLEFSGDGRMIADLRLTRGRLAPGSQLEVRSDNLASRFLDFEASGSGLLTAAIEGNSKTPAGKLEVFLLDFGLRRLDETVPYIKGHNFEITTVGKSFDPKNGISDLDTVIKLPWAEIPDLSIYNAYLPKKAGVAIVSGKGLVNANFQLSGVSGSGALEIEGREVEITIKDQTVKGNLRIDTRLRNGNLEDRTFDVSGTQLKIEDGLLETEDGVRDQHWWAQIDLETGNMTWKKPLDLEAKIGLELRDSGLLVNLFVKETKGREWLNRLLTIRDVTGQSEVMIGDNAIVLRNTQITGEKMLVLSNLRLREEKMRGALFARYGIFRLGVELRDGERKFRILNPRRWYDDFAGKFLQYQ